MDFIITCCNDTIILPTLRVSFDMHIALGGHPRTDIMRFARKKRLLDMHSAGVLYKVILSGESL
jgi:hypothetical protein